MHIAIDIHRLDRMRRIRRFVSGGCRLVDAALVVCLLFTASCGIKYIKDYRPRRQLFDAAFACDVEKAQALLNNGLDPNTQTHLGMRPLHVAGSCPALVGLLLKHGSTVDSNTMWSAITHGHPNSVWQLLATGFDMGSMGRVMGRTPLMQAARDGRTKAAHLLLIYGAEVNTLAEYGPVIGDFALYIRAEQKCGLTALMLASRNGHSEMVKLLLKRGADVSLVDREGCTALEAARRYRHSGIEGLLPK